MRLSDSSLAAARMHPQTEELRSGIRRSESAWLAFPLRLSLSPRASNKREKAELGAFANRASDAAHDVACGRTELALGMALGILSTDSRPGPYGPAGEPYFTSWKQLDGWLRQVERLRPAA